MREDIAHVHSQWFKEAEIIAQNIGIEVTKPRVVGRQRHRDNVDADSVEDYYRITTSVPLLDHISSEMTER